MNLSKPPLSNQVFSKGIAKLGGIMGQKELVVALILGITVVAQRLPLELPRKPTTEPR